MLIKLKHKIRLFLTKNDYEKSKVYMLLVKLNLLIFNFNEREHKKSFGNNNADKIFYLIRPMSKEEGLLSSFFSVVKLIDYAKKKGYIPYIDMQNYETQYNDEFCEIKNSWEYYFKQPSNYTLYEIYCSKNVILSGWKWKERNEKEYCNVEEYIRLIRDSVKDSTDINEYVKKIVAEKKKELFSGNTLGVFVRGTDYVKFKPRGHYIQPSIEMVFNKIDEYLKKYKIDNIFVVTEDYEIYEKLSDRYKGMVFSSDDTFIKDYDGKDYVWKYTSNNKYIAGLNYLIRVLLLNECGYLITSLASGSIFSLVMNEKNYKDYYIFDLGKY
ncbi:hypothetical protein [uncultured Clostridium sp.]|jgi:hypothetical protein|uniref:hypothetical protein n=1 Tax=uncultured Clostridium sp. TaxID=59620 RepID=UPI0025F03CF7|nr:hypothetical protein [uncultured Clostridium sp.]